MKITFNPARATARRDVATEEGERREKTKQRTKANPVSACSVQWPPRGDNARSSRGGILFYYKVRGNY